MSDLKATQAQGPVLSQPNVGRFGPDRPPGLGGATPPFDPATRRSSLEVNLSEESEPGSGDDVGGNVSMATPGPHHDWGAHHQEGDPAGHGHVTYGYRGPRIAPLDYESSTPRPPVYLMEAFTAPSNMQKRTHPDPPIANVPKPPHPSSMPYSHMGIYNGEDMLGGADRDRETRDQTKAHLDYSSEGENERPGLPIHAPTAPPPYPKPLDVFSWVHAQDHHASGDHPPDVSGPLSAPAASRETASYPDSQLSLDRPYKWLEDVTADQPIEADGFKRCSSCSISYRITDGKRCRCTPSPGDGKRPM